MMSLEEAKKVADGFLKDINHYAEYSNAYIFNSNESMFSFGGDCSPVVILKESGKAVNITYFYDEVCKEVDPISEGDI